MDLHQNRHFRMYQYCLKIFGLWPYQSKLWKIIMLTAFSLSTISLIVAFSAGLVTDPKVGQNVILENIAGVAFLTSALTQNFLYHMNDSKIQNLYEQFMMDWNQVSNKEESEILTRYTRKGLDKAPWIFIYTAPAFILLSMLTAGFPLFATIDTEYITIFPYYCKSMVINEKWRNLQVYLHTVIPMILVCLHYYTTCATSMICSSHICGIYAIVRCRLRDSIKLNLDNLECDSIDDHLLREDQVLSKLIDVVRKHNEAIHEVRLMEAVYSRIYLTVQILASVTFGILIYDILQNRNDKLQVFRPSLVVITYIMCAYFFNWCGEVILQTSDDISLDIYSLEWYTLSTKVQKLLLFIMRRSFKPERLSAGSLWDISFQNIRWFLQGSWSIATVFLSTRSKEKWSTMENHA